MNQTAIYTDKIIDCRDCHRTFVWEAGEQQFYAQKGFANQPVRCPDCRAAKKQRTAEGV